MSSTLTSQNMAQEYPQKVSVTLLGIAQIISWGTLYYSFPQIAEAVQEEFGWIKSDVYGALTLGLLLSATAAIPTGMLIDKGYGRRVMTIGSIAAGAIFILGSMIESLIGFYLVFASIGLLQAATLYDAAFAVVARAVDTSQTKKTITTLTLWGGFASTVFIPFIEFLLTTLNWREVLVVIGLINVFLCAGIYSRLPQKAAQSTQTVSMASKPKSRQGVRWAIQQPMFWALFLCFLFFYGTTTAFSFHLYPLLIEKGLSIVEVVAFLAILGPSQVAGRLILFAFSHRISMAKLGISIAALLPLVFASLAYLPGNFWALVPLAILFGAINGTMTIVKGTAVPEFLTPSSYGAINAAMGVPVKVIKALSPSLAAMLWVMTNSYDSLLNILMFLGAGSAIFFYWASRLHSSSTNNI
ncbi:MFS transporter [Pleionea sp. CnH1-48]|uniref:MFS transporter n=1 Tax=Pleionea sp. CnH1-48 TaxID=2954494 RepID=UPI0020975F99|nr:MFS transporter [Pleionea sp. CnH1-48]MCO7225127.1 MFS transporter [Pleionea sp. CnH1-48]